MARTIKSDEDIKWETQEDVRTLARAGEILKSEDRRKRAKAEAKRQMESLGKVSKTMAPKKKGAPARKAATKRAPVKKTARRPAARGRKS